MKRNLLELTLFNRFIIASVFTITALIITHTLWMGFSGIYELIVREELINENKYQVFIEMFAIGLYPVESSL
jgi:hypothetical protein